MRKIIRRKKKSANKTIFFVLFVLLIFLTTVYSLYSRQFVISGKATIPKPNQYSGVGIVEPSIQASWVTGSIKYYQYNLEIKNNSLSNIQGWQILMNIPTDYNVTSISNGIATISNGIVKIINNEYNSVITPGNTLTVFLEFTTSNTDYEINYLQFNGIQMNLSGQTVPATGISITESNIQMFPNQNSSLSIVFEPYNGTGTVTWSSSNNYVATVDSSTGIVTSNSPGTCTITATCGNLIDTCVVTVNPTIVQTSNLEIEFVLGGNSWPASGSFYNVQYQVRVKNISDSIVTGWDCDIVLPAGSSYNSGWNVNVTNTSGTTYHLVRTGTNIAPGATNTEIGMILIVPATNYIPVPININP